MVAKSSARPAETQTILIDRDGYMWNSTESSTGECRDIDPGADSVVTVVTPTRGRTELLLRAAQAVAEQQDVSIEHLIIGDDCPVLDDLRADLVMVNPAVRIINLPPWDSPSAGYTIGRIARARNAGIEHATGSYVCQLDSDNTITPDHVSSLLETLRTTGAQVAYCWRRLVYTDGSPYLLQEHPWLDDPDEAGRVFRERAVRGIYHPGTNLVCDRPDVGIDTGEFFLPTKLAREHPFKVDYTPQERADGLGEDDELTARLFSQGFSFAPSGLFSLLYRIGGRFTKAAAARRAAACRTAADRAKQEPSTIRASSRPHREGAHK